MVSTAPGTGARVIELYTTPLGPIGRFRFCTLLPEGMAMPVIRCRLLVKAESAIPSLAVFGPAPGAVNRTSYRFGVPSVGGLVEVGIEPGGAAQSANTSDSSDSDRDAGARGLLRVVPRNDPGVRESRSGRESRSNLHPEAHVDGLSGLQA